jgi:hypothetical protein
MYDTFSDWKEKVYGLTLFNTEGRFGLAEKSVEKAVKGIFIAAGQ